MSYIWNALIEAIQTDFCIAKIQYTVSGSRVSPYLEYLPVVLYDPERRSSPEERLSQIDINPYHRFGEIYKHILNPERGDPNDAVLCDLITHVLAEVDRICGMCKRDFQIMLVMKDLDDGCFGDAKSVQLFTVVEKRAIAEALIMFFRTSNSLRCLDTLFNMILTDFEIQIRDNREIVFYNPFAYDGLMDKKLRFIINLFLPVEYPYVIHWQKTYGTIGRDISIMLEEFVL